MLNNFERIKSFCNYFNNATTAHNHVRNVLDDDLAEAIKIASKHTVRDSLDLSVSQIYKPLIVTGAKKLGIKTDSPMGVSGLVATTYGNIFEQFVVRMLKEFFGDSLHSEQHAIKWEGITGHIDCMIDDTVIDVKTMAANYYKQFQYRPNDERGYVTQLAVYRDALPANHAGFIVLNKDTCKLKFVALTGQDTIDLDSVLDRASEKVESWHGIVDAKSLSKVLAPSPVEEVFNREPTGRLLIPPSLYGFACPHIVYNLQHAVNNYGQPRKYVVKQLNQYEKLERIEDEISQLHS